MESNELLEIYFSEAEDLLQRIEKNLLALEGAPDDPALVQEIFRAVHTMKSSAAMVGFEAIAEYAHLLENLLERMRSGQLPTSRPLISHLLTGQGLLRSMVDKASQGETLISPADLSAHKEQLTRFMGLQGLEERPPVLVSGTPFMEKQEHFYKIALSFKEDLFFTGQDPLMLLRELAYLGEIVRVHSDCSRVPEMTAINPFSLYLSWEIILRTQEPPASIEEVFCFVIEGNQVQIQDVTQEFPGGIDRSLADKRTGDILLEEGIVNSEDLQEALQDQKKIGQVLLEKKKITSETLTRLMVGQEKSRTLLRKSTIRVDTQKLDDLANFVEELSLNFSRVSHELEENGPHSTRILGEEMDRVEQNLREIREQVMRVRMFPLEGTFQRLQRMARDLAVEEGKELKVEIHGTETELDKDLIEQITDPLKHCIRNVIDHGLESPEERQKSGKSRQGLLTIKALQREGKILIQVEDDGRGLDEEAIYQKALEKKLIPPGTRPASTELQRLILLPGFSTASRVSDLSGRGVGLDVVQDQITRINGLIDLVSAPGQGTIITLSIPLTMAVLEGFRIALGEESYIVPLTAVLAVRAIQDQDLKTIETREEVLRFEERYIPAVRLENLLGIPARPRANGKKIALILDSQKKRFALLADQILETRQVVIKGLETHFRSIPGFAGGAILGDGRVCLILDIYGLDRLIFGD